MRLRHLLALPLVLAGTAWAGPNVETRAAATPARFAAPGLEAAAARGPEAFSPLAVDAAQALSLSASNGDLGTLESAEAAIAQLTADPGLLTPAASARLAELRAQVREAREAALLRSADATARALGTSEWIKAETAALHKTVQRHPFEKGLLKAARRRDFRLEQYQRWLGQNLLLHETLEPRLLERRRDSPAVAAVIEEAALQAPNLRADLSHFGVDPASTAPSPAIERFRSVVAGAATDPFFLLGMHYVVEGRKNGSHFISIVLRRLLGLKSGEGYRYMDPHGGEQLARWKGYKARLDAQPMTDAQAARFLAGARAMYAAVLDVNDGLLAAPAPGAAAKRSSRWLKRGGAALFLFFLLKGLAWVLVPLALVYFGWR